MKTRPSSPQLVLSGAHLVNPYVGVGVYTLRLLRGLAKADWVSFKVLVPEIAGQFIEQLPPGCSVIVKGKIPAKLPQIGGSLYWMNRIAAVACRDYPEAVFHSTGSFWSLRQPGKTVVTLHDCIYRRYPFYMGRYPFRRWMIEASERYAARAALILTVSRSAAADLREMAAIPDSKLKVIYQWVEDRFNVDFCAGGRPLGPGKVWASAGFPPLRRRLRLPKKCGVSYRGLWTSEGRRVAAAAGAGGKHSGAA